MQGGNNEEFGLDEELEELYREREATIEQFGSIDARIAQLEEQRRRRDRAERKRMWRLIKGAGAAAVIADAATRVAREVRNHPTALVAAIGLIAAVVAGQLVFRGPGPMEPEIVEPPPRAIGAMPPVPPAADDPLSPEAPPVEAGEGAGTGEPSPAGSPSTTRTPSPTGTSVPTATATPTRSPSPTISPTSTPEPPDPTPSLTSTPTSSPTPTPTVTLTPSPTPTDDPLLCIDVSDLLELEACVDVPLLDGLLGGRGLLYG